jgi:hypothetical protein
VVVLFDPFHLTLDDGTKPVPITESVNAPPRALTETGFNAVIVGSGLATVKVLELDVPPPGVGLLTVTLTVAAVARSEAEMIAVKRVDETKVVGRDVPPHRTADDGTKPLPSTVIERSAPPAVAVVGLMLTNTGSGLLTTKLREFDVPPPGEGFHTATLAVRPVAISALVMVACS